MHKQVYNSVVRFPRQAPGTPIAIESSFAEAILRPPGSDNAVDNLFTATLRLLRLQTTEQLNQDDGGLRLIAASHPNPEARDLAGLALRFGHGDWKHPTDADLALLIEKLGALQRLIDKAEAEGKVVRLDSFRGSAGAARINPASDDPSGGNQGVGKTPLEAALAYVAENGFAVFPCHPGTKKPLIEGGGGFKGALCDPAVIRAWWREHPHADIGVAVPDGVAIVDLDEKKGKHGIADFIKIDGRDPTEIDTPITTSPTGGLHLWFAANGRRLKQIEEWNGTGIDTRIFTKGYVILPHDGNGRRWLRPLSTPLMDAPAWLPEEKPEPQGAPEPREKQPFGGEATPKAKARLADACDALASAPPGQRNRIINSHAFAVGILVRGGKLDQDAALDALIDAQRRCTGTDPEYLDKVRKSFADGTKKGRETAERKGKRLAAHLAGATAPWLDACLRDDKDRVIANLANVMIALRGDLALADAFAFDEMAQAKLLQLQLPVAQNGEHAESDPVPRQVRDEDVSQLQEWLQHCGLPHIGKDIVHQAVDQRARELSFHPLRQWLDGLVWDGTERLSTWLKVYLGATGAPDYLAAIGRMFLISMVARVYKPGCKVDYMLVLEGGQGILKSLACKALTTEQYFADSLPDIHHKDASQHLRGKWLVEVSELAAFTRAETETLKAFITRTHEKYRPPYGRENVSEPRQCVFAGTTNKDAYLKDETGARRFWPVPTTRIDVAGLRRDRGQLFAEAVDRYRHDEQWWPEAAFERAHIKPEQEARFEDDPWEAAIGKYVENTNSVRIIDIARGALGFDGLSRIGTAEQRRISAVLFGLGWKRGPRVHGGDRPYVRGR